ncbi:MAG TPA: hypothetical protein VF762_03285 [Blastocatellia bacterium]
MPPQSAPLFTLAMSKVATVKGSVTREPALLPEATIERMTLGVLMMSERAPAPPIVILVIVPRAKNASRPAEGYNTHGAHIPVRPHHTRATAMPPAAHTSMLTVRGGNRRERKQDGKRHY